MLIGHIVDYLQETRGVHPGEFSAWNEDIERFLTEIDDGMVSLSPRLKEHALPQAEAQRFMLLHSAYNQLVFLFASILNEIQNGPVSIPYALLASELTEEDACITFNWDTLMDRALASVGKWSPVSGYLMEPESIFDDGWRSPESFETGRGAPQYLKLHGSTNWLTPYHFIDFSTGEGRTLSGFAADKLFVFLKATTAYQTYKNRYWGPYEPYSYCYYPPDLPCESDAMPLGHMRVSQVCAPDLQDHGRVVVDDKSVYSMPLIVPPVRDKQYLRYGRVFSVLWDKANKALSNCEELYVIGYSFPSTDTVSRSLFKEALTANTNIKKVVIWNPHPDNVANLCVDAFGVKRCMIHVRAEVFDPLSSPTSRVLCP